ncbi:aminoglycoside phosphotransferase [Solihabitans fulvus]|uniref:Maltokinase n=1 Tax=Solihabitans fulvus TaxID=1892852 RepID=A0A5B2X8P0_9PSEU|nr:aminoglycoside phosphotransferase [Solihabitans fulvus]KAA2259506.1 aminoglycoside phosphotransferase [Solihabitans fulvus]
MPEPSELVSGLVAGLPGWLPNQRWFAGKDRPVLAVRPLRSTVLHDGDPLLVHVMVEVEQQDRREPYQLLVGDRHELPDHLRSSWIGPGYEASADSDATAPLLDLIAGNSRVDTLVFETEPGVQLETGLRARPITSEQSNTSLVFGHQYILKLFRRLTPGPNPDLVRHRALHAVGCEHIAEPLGSITGELAGQPTTLGMLQPFVADAVDGWAMATTSVRDLMAEADLHADEVGGDFAAEAHRLGHAVGAVHSDLDRALGHEQLGPERLAGVVAAMQRRLDAVLTSVPELGAYEAELRAAFDKAVDAEESITVQHVHGDLHLGQVLRTVSGWLLIDFEGEPAAPAEDRVALHSPLRDVAGMLRSFDYAAHQLLVGQPEDHQLARRAMEWSRRNRDAFCDGYAEVATRSVGDPRGHATLLRAFELDKAVYEVAYEHANRPEWLTVPLSSIARITTEGDHQ